MLTPSRAIYMSDIEEEVVRTIFRLGWSAGRCSTKPALPTSFNEFQWQLLGVPCTDQPRWEEKNSFSGGRSRMSLMARPLYAARDIAPESSPSSLALLDICAWHCALRSWRKTTRWHGQLQRKGHVGHHIHRVDQAKCLRNADAPPLRSVRSKAHSCRECPRRLCSGSSRWGNQSARLHA